MDQTLVTYSSSIKFLHLKVSQTVSYFNSQVARRKFICHNENYGQNKQGKKNNKVNGE